MESGDEFQGDLEELSATTLAVLGFLGKWLLCSSNRYVFRVQGACLPLRFMLAGILVLASIIHFIIQLKREWAPPQRSSISAASPAAKDTLTPIREQ